MEFIQKIVELDKELFLYLNSFHSEFCDYLMFFITRKETWIPLYIVVLFFLIKNFRKKSIVIIIAFALLILLSDQLSVLIKETVQRLRPVYEPSIEHLVHNFFRKGGQHGFISSHATNMFAIYTFTKLFFRNRSYSILFFIWALTISYSRIYLGVHYPLDILGGALLGIFLGWLMHKLVMFVELHFLIGSNPKIAHEKLKESHSRTIYIVIVIMMATMLLILRNLFYYNFL